MKEPKFEPGDVVLMHVPDEEQVPGDPIPDEVGTVEEVEVRDPGAPEDQRDDIVYVVRAQRPLGPDDDCLREVGEGQLSYYRPIGHHRRGL